MTDRTLAIIGASLAGAKTAEGARDAGYHGRIVLIGDEPLPPYERPPLSKDVLRGDKPLGTTYVHPDGFYADNAIELVTDRAVSLDVAVRRVQLASGRATAFDTLVIATGAEPRVLQAPRAGLAGVHTLRTIDDSVRLHSAIRRGGRVAIIGAGWIGSEVAASARQMGAEVVLMDPAPAPLHRVLGDEVASVFRDLDADHGVTLRLGSGVAELRGTGAVESVVLDEGRIEAADVVMVGIGVLPRTELAVPVAAIEVDDGIRVDLDREIAGTLNSSGSVCSTAVETNVTSG
jgi:3-phenylpropionate/trans-cinnamate dioxygenase ferredoxin reductase subunit